MRTHPHIAILGTVEVVGARRGTALPGSNLPALLSLLALSPGRPVPNDRIIEALWPEADPAKARRSLISLVHHLNATLAAQFGIDRAVVSVKSVGRVLTIDPSRIDVAEFELRIAAAEVHEAHGDLAAAVDTYRSALRLWRGEPFGGADLACFVEPSARLRALRDRAESALIGLSLRIGRGSALVPRLMQRTLDDPSDEAAASDAARALYQAGRSGEALRVLRSCMDERRLGRLPIGDEMRRLEVAVLEHDLEIAEAVGAKAGDEAVGRSGLIGRDHERAMLRSWLDESARDTVMLLTGEAGMGKTALIEELVTSLPAGHRVIVGRAVRGGDPLGPFRDVVADERHRDLASDALLGLVMQVITDPDRPLQTLVVDDAQWLAPAAVGLLRHIVLGPDIAGLRVLVSARTPEVTANEALAQLTSDLVRAGRSAHIVLRPFERTELDEMIGRYRADASTLEIDADVLLRLTGGNPLFAREVLTWTGSGIAPAVTETYSRFVDHLSEGSLAILRAAAELGPSGEPRRLAEHAGASELDVIDALDEVAGGRLVHVEREGGAYSFVTELARRVVLDALDPSG